MEWFRLREWFTPGKSQGFLVLLAGLLVSIFAGILTTSTPVYAADATWEGAKLRYQNQEFNPVNDDAALVGLDLSDASRVYANSVPGSATTPSELRVIAFASGANMATAISAEYIVFDYTPPSTFTQKSSATISTDPAGENSSGLEQGSSCTISGVGWFICPAANYLATGMDWLYGVLTQFLVSQPLNVSDTSTGLYQAWKIMLGIANAAFIIVFVVIIYSHLTSFGVSNYGIKKLLPRLVIAAILVNISYYICAIAIDLSNIIGQSIQDMFISIRNTMTTVGSATGDEIPTWEVVTAFILSGGAAVAGAGTFFITYAGSIGGASIMLVPMLLGVLLTVIVVLLVLAARQALIVILTIISPLAFVCYLLPGTEKWFEKWRSTFFTMLLFFPAFSAVFGGSQLAGAVIIQNADSLIMLLLGLGVQIAPLAIAPLILKLSGGLLNRFAGIVNNPAKGLLDRSRNLAKNQSDYMVAKARANPNGKKFQPLRGMGRRAYNFQQRRKERIENYQKMADAAYEATGGHADIDRQRREIEQGRQLTEKQLDLNWNAHVKLDTKALEKDIELRVRADQVELSNQELNNRYAEFKGGRQPFIGPMSEPMTNLIEDAQTTTQRLAVEGLRQSNAQRALNVKFAEDMLTNNSRINGRSLQEDAGSIYEFGQDAALASAIATMRNDYGKSVEEGRQIVKQFELSADDRQEHAMGGSVQKTIAVNGVDVTRTFEARNVFTREASIEDQMIVGTVDQVKEIVVASGSTLSEFKGTISESLAKSGVKNKAPFMGGKLIDDIVKGAINSEDAFVHYVQEWIANGKYKPDDIAITDPQGLAALMKAANTPALTAQMAPKPNETPQDFVQRQHTFSTKLNSGLTKLSRTADRVVDDENLNAHISEGSGPLLEKIRAGDFTP